MNAWIGFFEKALKDFAVAVTGFTAMQQPVTLTAAMAECFISTGAALGQDQSVFPAKGLHCAAAEQVGKRSVLSVSLYHHPARKAYLVFYQLASSLTSIPVPGLSDVIPITPVFRSDAYLYCSNEGILWRFPSTR